MTVEKNFPSKLKTLAYEPTLIALLVVFLLVLRRLLPKLWYNLHFFQPGFVCVVAKLLLLLFRDYCCLEIKISKILEIKNCQNGVKFEPAVYLGQYRY